MKTYSVKQVAKLLNTNPETVRRWIRDDKLKAVQISRKDGNVITETDLDRFLTATPKYLPVFVANAAFLSPAAAGFAVAGSAVGAMYYTVLHHMKERNIHITVEALKEFLKEQITHNDNVVQQKQALIEQTNEEIIEIVKQNGQLQYMLEHENVLISMLENNDMEEDE